MLFATAWKEITLLLRDMHALAVLFLMPLVFVVIMSLAMPDDSAEQSAPALRGALFVPADSLYNRTLVHYLRASEQPVQWQAMDNDLAALQQALRERRLDVLLVLPAQADGQPLEQTDSRLLLAPHVDTRQRVLVQAMVQGNLGKVRLFMFLKDARGASGDEALAAVRAQAEATTAKDRLQHDYLFAGQPRATPTAVQQSVPAWLVFGMFFVLIPLSSTMIIELQQGTLRRLQSMNVAAGALLGGKLLPYFFINQLQFVLMLAAGLWLIPLLGGTALVINGSFAALALVSAACSVAALGFAMLLSVLARSTEQATALGGAANIILAAIGGIMIPKHVMPPLMQQVADVSPMSWALDGFLQVILYGGGLADVLLPVAALLAFAAAGFTIAVRQFKKRSGYYG